MTKFILWLHFIYLCSKARISSRGIFLRIKFFTHHSTQIKYVGLIVKSPVTHEFIQLSGMSENSFHEALKKAFSEYLESVTFWDNNLPIKESRSGMATHFNKDQCYQNAYEELIERDSFIMHIYSPILKTTPLPTIGDINFVKLQSIDEKINVVLARGTYNQNQFISLAAHQDLNSAINKARLELVMLFNEAPEFKTTSEKSISNILLEHFQSAQSENISQLLDSLLKGGGDEIIKPIDNYNVEIKIEKKFGGFICLKLTSPDLLLLKFGSAWKNEYQNHTKIFNDRGLKISPFLIHPLL